MITLFGGFSLNKYTKEFIIPYYDSDKSGFVRPESLITYMGETSSFHSSSLGVGIEELSKYDYAWILNRWKVKIIRYPKVRDKITIETWTSTFDKFYATREFMVYDNDKNEICRATTLWIFLDMNKKMPRRIPKELYGRYNIVDEKLLHDFYSFNLDIKSNNGIDFYVRKSDIDYNNHVNNVKYLNWMLEVIPERIDMEYKLCEFDIQYKRETKFGSTVISEFIEEECEEEDKQNIGFLHRITENHEINTFGRTIWKKKNPL